MYIIEFYKDRNGKSEVYEYIRKLNKNNNKENSTLIRLLYPMGYTIKIVPLENNRIKKK